MEDAVFYIEVYLGVLLMLYNILQYSRFIRIIRERGIWVEKQELLYIPVFLLVLFFISYMLVSVFSTPDLITGTIMLSGAVFATVMLALIRRISERLRIIERQDARMIAAEESSAARSFLLTNMSHDIRTPLNAILGYTVLAKRKALTLGETRAYLEKIERSGQDVLNILNDTLDISRIVEGRIYLEPKIENLETVVTETCDLLSSSMEMRHIRFQRKLNITHHWLVFDRNHLNRILVNLLGTSCKFAGEKGSVWLTVQEIKSMAPYKEDAWYEIHIRDNGPGLNQQIARNFFVPFEHDQNSMHVMDQDTALDMAITRKIIDAKGGKIEVKTEQGKGTEFIVRLHFPIAETQDQPDEIHQEAKYDFTGKKLLVVEDGEINREIAKELLCHAGFEVVLAENGQIGLDILQKSKPGEFDAVLMDIQMPVMDGYEATEAIRALPDEKLSRIPIIAMTANVFREDIIAAEKAGMQGHVGKPLNLEAMLRTLADVLEVRGN